MDGQGQRMKNSESDIISNLPDNIAERILARLPIRDAVRTSVLSRNWRYKWTTLPDLVFDAKDTDASTFCTNPALKFVNKDKLVKVIYRILFQHKGPIHKFSLSIRNFARSYPDIDQWISFLSKKCIRVFFLGLFNSGNRYKIHSSLFSCANLMELSLHCCIIPSPPPTFSGFKNLISNFSKLNSLNLIYMDGLDILDIDDAPKLQELTFEGVSLKNISLKNTPCLSDVSISYSELPDMSENIGNGRSISLIDNLNFLSDLKMFAPGFYFLKLLARGSVRNLLPSTFKNLTYLHITELMLNDIDSLSSTLSLITTSPNLVRVYIWVCIPSNSEAGQRLKTAAEYLEGKSHSIGCLMKLKHVEMEGIMGAGPEMELIKLILSKSPSLECMKITLDKTVDGIKGKESEILRELLRFPRASTIAEII
ncbi:hypothetical protein PTKIN_Ptkin02bG0033500 [Pterospermum kingtungense]